MDAFEFRGRTESGVDARTEALAEAVIGAAIEVHRLLGPGLPEVVYRQAMSHEFGLRDIPHDWEVRIPIIYKDQHVGHGCLDLLVDKVLVVELKVVESLAPVHRAQALSYLRMTGLQHALLINFNVPILKDGIKRVICTR